MDRQELNSYFTEFQNDFRKVNEYNDKIYSTADFEEWLALIGERSEFVAVFRSLTDRFSDCLDAMKQNPPTDEECDFLYGLVLQAYGAGIIEPFISEKYLAILIPHYVEKKDDAKILFLKSFAGLIYSDVARSKYGDYAKMSRECYDDVLAYKDSKALFEQPLSMACFFVSYYNYIQVLPTVGGCTLKECYDKWIEFGELRKDEKYRAFDDKMPFIPMVVAMIENNFVETALWSYENMGENDEDLKKELIAMTKEKYEKDGDFDFEKYRNDRFTSEYYSYIFMLVVDGRITFDEAFEKLDGYFRKNTGRLKASMASSTDAAALLGNPLIMTFQILEQTTLPAEEKHETVLRYCGIVTDIVSKFPRGVQSYAMDTVLQEVAFNGSVHKMIGNAKESRNFIYDFVQCRQIMTFLHTSMVTMLSKVIAESAVDEKPEFFVGMPGCRNKRDVTANRAKILDFVQESAQIHDLGKNAIIQTVNMDYRRLTDSEFALLKAHPDRGAEFAAVVEDFKQYSDVIRGHHKFSNGQGGYPADFDNTKSEVKIVIDIVTLADCMDAATDYVGRSYRKAKTFEEVLGEFTRDAGTRYNADLVKFISNNTALRSRLQYHVEKGRIGIYKNIYNEFFCK